MTVNLRSSTLVHLPSGQFAPGNPGRPKGSKNRISNEALIAIKSMKDEAIMQLREKLISGDFQAITFVLERILPRGRTIEMEGTGPADITEMLQSGELTTVEIKDIATALAKINEITELAQIRLKLDDLERMISDGARN